MTKKKFYIGLGYWPEKKQWVDVPLFFVPEGAERDGGLYEHYMIPLDGVKIDPSPRRENKGLEKIEVAMSMVPWNLSPKKLKQFCTLNDISYYWVTGRSSGTKKRRKGRESRRKERKVQSLNPRECKRIIRELYKVDEQSALIVEILWFHNELLGQGGGYVTLEEILRAKVEDVFTDFAGPQILTLKREAIGASHMTSIYLPDRIWKPLCQRTDKSLYYVFSNRHGGPLRSIQIDKHIKIAANNAGLKGMVTSLSFRPELNEEAIKRSIRSAEKSRNLSAPEENLAPISLDEWNGIAERFPSISKRRGRRSMYHPMDLFNAILHHLREGCPLRKLPPSFPPYSAFEGQYRRWKKNGVFLKVLKFRTQKSNP